MPHDLGRIGEFSVLLATSACVLSAAALAAPIVREQVARHLPGKIGSRIANPDAGAVMHL
jgi:hypothetical protein